jgi:chromate transporter
LRLSIDPISTKSLGEADPFPVAHPSLGELFLAFLRLGLTAFGGPSMVAYIRRLAVERKGWLRAKDFGAGVALCQMIPGATAMQSAAYVGLYLKGVPGAAATFVGFGLPAFLLMTFFAIVYSRTGSLPQVAAVFAGLQAVVVGIVANAAFSFGKTTLKSWRQYLIAAAAAALYWFNVSPLVVILLAAAAGWQFLPMSDAFPAQAGRSTGIPLYKKSLAAILVGAGLALAAFFFLYPELFRLAVLMIRVDLTAFGGGFASVPVMYHEVVEVNRWVTAPTFMNGIVLGQVTPGPIVITATFIGYLLGGIPGAVIATISIFLPSFLLVIGIAPFFDQLSRSPAFRKVIQGVLCSFVGLLISVTLRFIFQIEWTLIYALLAAGALAVLLKKVDILWVVLGGVALSILLLR